ncbi:MAG: peptidase MA family metallohydrolase [Anaerolineae bacterium]|nr:peptidase MA family metallohydrolase [Anaerolineae bacterium]
MSAIRLIACFGLLLGLMSFSHAEVILAQQAPQVEHYYTFGQSIEITLTLPTGSGDRKALLLLETSDGETEAHTLSVKNNKAYYQRDLRENPFSPFVVITYRFEYNDIQGTPHKTEPVIFLYEDNRFEWQTLSEDNLTVKWVDGDTTLMINALDIARTSLNEITALLQGSTLDTAAIYIYPSLPDLQMALRLSGREWVGGKANPDVGVVLLAIPASEEAVTQMQQYIPHELTHLVLYEKMGAQGYPALPTWFNEGLASYFEQRPEAAYTLALENAQKEGSLISLSTLNAPFYSMSTDQIILAYAESQSVVTYIQQRYGWSGMRALVDAYTDGLEYSRGIEKALGIDLTTLEREWRIWLEQGSIPEEQLSPTWTFGRIALREMAPWLLVALLLLVPSALPLIGPRLKRGLSA